MCGTISRVLKSPTAGSCQFAVHSRQLFVFVGELNLSSYKVMITFNSDNGVDIPSKSHNILLNNLIDVPWKSN